MNRVNKLFGIKYPIIQGGMVWCSGWKLASAVSNAGGLGLIGSGSMSPEILLEHIKKCKDATSHAFGVNVPLLYKNADDHIDIIIKERVKIVFTSAGSPKKYTSILKDNGIIVAHVVSNKKFAIKSENAGVDAIVVEGFEAGGHNGREELTTMTLIPLINKDLKIPLIAAGGIGCGRSMLAAMSLGADGVQIGSRFAVSKESSAHLNFKQYVIDSEEGDTDLTLKEIVSVRLMKNTFYERIQEAYNRNASLDDLRELLGKGRAKKGIFHGDLQEGELEIGQVSAMIDSILPAKAIVDTIVEEFNETMDSLIKI
jgi:enoyl-[acyl-carrier protein] reductase II